MDAPAGYWDPRTYLAAHVFPALTVLAVGPGHPSVHLREGSLNIAVIIDGKTRDGGKLLAFIEVPGSLEHLAGLIVANAGDLFPGFKVAEAATFRMTHARELQIDPSASAQMVERLAELIER
jgi:polyphosphate kinase